MREIDLHQAIDAIKAGKDVFVLIPVTKVLYMTEFLDAGRYCIDEPDQEQPKRQAPNAIPLDFDKIMEMRKAGMTYDQIGEEMGCTGVTISNFLKREGKKRAEKGE